MNITVYGKPLGQPRQRVAVRGGHGVNYLPGSHPIHGFKHEIRSEWRLKEFGMLDGPVKCTITAIFERPKSKTRKRGDNPRLAHMIKPDCDNLAKGILDALNGVAFKDDSQVVELTVRKFTGTPDELARVEVSIEQTGASE